jgi:hypothetical protein
MRNDDNATIFTGNGKPWNGKPWKSALTVLAVPTTNLFPLND